VGLKRILSKAVNLFDKDSPKLPEPKKLRVPDATPKFDASADPPPPGAKLPDPTTPLEHANRAASSLPAPPKLIDPKAELGDAPIRKLAELPDVPTRTPLTKTEKSGFKNRMKGVWEGAQNAGMQGASGPGVIGAMIGGAINRENPNRQLWEQRELLPAIQTRNARTREIIGAQKGYDDAAQNIETRNKNTSERHKTEAENVKWAEELRAKALENEASRKAKADENKAVREGNLARDDAKHKQALEMRERWERHNAEQKELDRKNRLTVEQMQANEAMRRARFQADNNLERDFYRYTAEGGDSGEPSEDDIKRDMDAAASVGMPITREQAIDQVKKRSGKTSKPGASKAAQAIANKYGGSWKSVPAGK
jgi:hypothetical protein